MKLYLGLLIVGSSLTMFAAEPDLQKLYQENVKVLSTKMKNGTLTPRWFYPNIQNLILLLRIKDLRYDVSDLKAIATTYRKEIIEKAEKFLADPIKFDAAAVLNLVAELMLLNIPGVLTAASDRVMVYQLHEDVLAARDKRSDSAAIKKEMMDASLLSVGQVKQAPPLPPKNR